jgi:hypothetical protein
MCSFYVCRFESFFPNITVGSGSGSSRHPSTRASVANESEVVDCGVQEQVQSMVVDAEEALPEVGT